LFAIATIATAQIKIAANGNVGIGTNTTDKGKVTISNNGVDFVFHPYNKTDGYAYFGMHNSKGDPWLNFYHPTEGYNKVRFKQSILSSDSTLKTGIILLENATTILKQIKTYSYYFKSDSVYFRSDSLDERKREYGVLGQELQEIMPDLVDTCMETMFVNYNAFIAILIKGFNEQQAVIEALQNIVLAQELDILQLKQLKKAFNELQEIVSECCKPKNMSPPLQIEEPLPEGETAILYQNIPNPFSSNTEISCYLPESTTQSTLFIYNLQGAQLKEFSLTQTGMNTITVCGSELPAGMYLYTLVVDNEIIDTKRMILTR